MSFEWDLQDKLVPRGCQLIFSCWYLLSSNPVKKAFQLVSSSTVSMSIETDGVFHNSCIEIFFSVFIGITGKKVSILCVYSSFMHYYEIICLFSIFFLILHAAKISSYNYLFVVDLVFFFSKFHFLNVIGT